MLWLPSLWAWNLRIVECHEEVIQLRTPFIVGCHTLDNLCHSRGGLVIAFRPALPALTFGVRDDCRLCGWRLFSSFSIQPTRPPFVFAQRYGSFSPIDIYRSLRKYLKGLVREPRPCLRKVFVGLGIEQPHCGGILRCLENVMRPIAQRP